MDKRLGMGCKRRQEKNIRPDLQPVKALHPVPGQIDSESRIMHYY
jgi:hypothetical protein